MGAWGHGPLDNDAAADLLAEVSQLSGAGALERLIRALRELAAAQSVVQSDVGDEAYAAAAILIDAHAGESALADEHGSVTLPRISQEDAQTAARALGRLASREDNEWLDLWRAAGQEYVVLERLEALRNALP